MKVLDPGHLYSLETLDGKELSVLRFVKREGSKYPDNVGSYPGTTMQEVLRALVDRAKYVNHQTPAWETRLAVHLMTWVIWLFERRAAKRHRRPTPSLRAVMCDATCSGCLHVGCMGECQRKE